MLAEPAGQAGHFDVASRPLAFGLAYAWAVLAWFDALPVEITGQAEPDE